MTEKPNPIHRPRVVILVSIVLLLTALIPLLFICGGLVFLLSRISDPNSITTSELGALVIGILVGALGSSYSLWKVWAFYSLNPMDYTLVKMDFKYGIWIPNFIVWIVTKRGKRLDDKDVRGAFGLRDDEF